MTKQKDHLHHGNHAALSDAYLAHAQAVSHGASGESTVWPRDTLDELVRNDPDAAWPLIAEVISRADDDATLAYIAAGPLEDLIVLHNADVIDRIEASAAESRRIRRALSGVWADGDIPTEISDRLHALVKGESPL